MSSARLVQVGRHSERNNESSPVLLVIAHARPDYLRRCLNSVLKHHPADERWRIVVSLDRQDREDHSDVEHVVINAQLSAEWGTTVQSWIHEMDFEDDSHYQNDEDLIANTVAYRRISRHYEWALRRAFEQKFDGGDLQRVVVIEEDMEIAPDFFNYFDALSPLLDDDPTLFCISAWNDNGKENLISSAEQLHRTDFFPGLGWMITRSFWIEVKHKWPNIYWDDWLRSEDQSKGRQCIRPETSRTANFGSLGASSAFNFDDHISKVILNQRFVNFSALDLSYLNPLSYEDLVFGRMSRAVLLKYSNYLTSYPMDNDVIAQYPPGNPEAIGRRIGIMTDHRNGMFRTSYRGVIIISWNNHWAFLVSKDWKPPQGYSLGSSECCDRRL